VSEGEQDSRRELSQEVQAFLQRLYRDPRYLLIGKADRHGRELIAFIESCTVLSATGEVRGQVLLNKDYELRGRPDRERPYAAESLLDYHLSRGPGAHMMLDEEQLAALRDESWQYYVRRNFAFLLGDFGQARDDAEHNLGICDLIADAHISDEAKWSYLRWWPWIERDRAIGQALLDLQQGQAHHAATGLYRAHRSIQQFGERHAEQYAREEGDTEPLCTHLCQHVTSLVELLRSEEQLPVSLEDQLDAASARGDQAEVERLRNEMIRRAMEEID
jgi:hypothetical protein